MNQPTPESARSLPPWAPFVVLIIAIVAQAAVLQGGWLLDDATVIRDNAEVAKGISAVPRFFANGEIGGELEPGAYRPLMLATFAVESSLWRDDRGEIDPFLLHLMNLLLHAAAAMLLLVLIRRAAPDRPILALGAALAFAAHPMNTGTVTALLGRADLLAAVFGLAALCVWIRPRGLGTSDLILVALLFFFALLSKESALAFVVAFPILDRFGRGKRGSALARYGVVGGVLVLFILLWPGRAGVATDLTEQPVLSSVALSFAAVGRMALRFLVPVGYRGDHTDEASAADGFTLEGLSGLLALVVVALAIIAFVRWRQGHGSALGLGWILVVLSAPIAAAVLHTGAPLELRFGYIIGIPLFLAVGVAGEIAWRTMAGRGAAPALGWAGTAVLVACFALLSHGEADAWHGDEEFHERLLRESPHHLGALIRQGRLKRRLAEQLRLQASLMPTRDAQGRPNLELERARRRRRESLETSEGWVRRALNHREGQQTGAVWAELGFVQLARGRAAESLNSFAKAKRFDELLQRPEGASATGAPERQLHAAAAVYYAEGQAHKALGDTERASGAYQSAIRLSPRDPVYLRAAAMALMGQRRWGEGIPLLKRAIRYASGRTRREELTKLLEQQIVRAAEMADRLYREAEQEFAAQRREEALPFYEAAFLANPKLIDAYIKAANIMGSYMGNYGRAHKYLNDAERVLREAEVLDEVMLKRIRRQRTFLQKRKQDDDAPDGG